VDPRELLQQELDRRRRRNRRYSLRAFARDLATDHSALSQLLRGRRPFSPRMVHRFGVRLGWSETLMGQVCLLQAADVVLRMVRSGRYRPDCRHIAARTGVPIVAVGGVGPEHARALRAAGAHGVACIRAVMAAPDPAAAVDAFCQELI